MNFHVASRGVTINLGFLAGGHGVIPISLFLLATGTVLCKAAIYRGVWLSTGRYGCGIGGIDLNARGHNVSFTIYTF